MTKISKTKYRRPTSDEINEIINDKDQLEHEMIEFILGIPSLRNYEVQFRKFAQLWEALNGKMKQLKKRNCFMTL
ncbi:hypothetical protein Glove_276g20 [Diversispora epigaea]|uniref:Uncharacterized protein n=1 Tax=Diversispora epigaea TaxID=1348612 RepID=A0A397I4U4_9GLOM|nr:hypothetical protein Glove_276g20 [Diversispora epigaea]